MTKFSSASQKSPLAGGPDRMFEVKPFSRLQPKSPADVRDDQRIKKALKQAVERDFAPQHLIDAIRSGIRR